MITVNRCLATFYKQPSIWLVFYFFSQVVYAQHPVHYSIDVDKGLPSNEVYQLLQDRFGYIWIGSDAGLFRYDGFVFKPYKNIKQNSRSVSSLQMDKQGRIWCRNFTGQILRVQNDSLIVVEDMSNRTIVNNQYTLDDKSTVWFFRENVLVNADGDGLVIQETPLPSKSLRAPPQYIHYYKGEIFVSLRNSSLYAYTIKDGTFEELSVDHPNFENRINSFFIWKDTLRLLSVMTQTRSFLISTVRNKRIEPEHEYFSTNQNSRVHELTPDCDGNLWVCTSDGTFPYSKKIKYLDEHRGYFKSLKVSYVLKDREGLYWVSTLQNGIFVSPSLRTRLWNSVNSRLTEDNLTSLAVHQNTLMIGSYSGKITSVDPVKLVVRSVDGEDNTPTLNTKKIISSEVGLFVAHGPLTEVSPSGHLHHFPPHNIRDFMIVRDTVFYIYPDFISKVSLYDIRNDMAFKAKKLRHIGGRAMAYIASEDAFYFACNDGLFRYTQHQWIEVRYQGKSIHAMALSIYQNTVWVATLLNGVLSVESGRVAQSVDRSNGLLENEIKCIKAGSTEIWASSNLYLYRINPTTGTIGFYASSAGFNPSDINGIELLHGNVYLATNRGLIEMPDSLQWSNPVRPIVSILSINLNKQAIEQTAFVELPYANSNFRIDFSATAFRSKGNFFYEHRLTGLDAEWVRSEASNPYVVYSSLPPGDYTFEVRALNENFVAGDSQSFHFTVSPPVWQTWWFYLLASITFVVLVVVVYSLRIRYLRQRIQISTRLAASQLTALKAQMNPHFMYNALNSIQDLVTNKDVKNSNLYLGKFSSLMRKILDASGAEEISLQEEVEILNLYLELEKLRFGDDFTYELRVDDAIDTNSVLLPSMIFQPFVENAIKHGLLHKRGEKKLSIHFTANTVLTCTITDTGVGRKRAAEIQSRFSEKHASFATKATEKRIELLSKYSSKKYNFEICDLEENGQSQGTQVIIHIPL